TIVPTAEPEAVRLPTVQPPTAIAPAESPPASAPTAVLSAPTGPTALSQSVRIPLVQQPNVAPTALPQVVRIPLIQQPDRGVAQPPPAADPKCASGGRAAYGKRSPRRISVPVRAPAPRARPTAVGSFMPRRWTLAWWCRLRACPTRPPWRR